MKTQLYSAGMLKVVLVCVITILLISLLLFPMLARASTPATQPAPRAPAAMLIVTSTADSGAGSLRQAIANAAPGDTIAFSLTYPAVITLTSQSLTITKPLTVSGPGAASLTVSGNNARRVFYITSTVAISGITIAKGRVSSIGGGGIYNDFGALTLNNSVVVSNTGSSSGGGIRNVSGTLTLNHSTIMSNTASNGGGIWNISGTLTINSSTLKRNTVEYGGGGLYNQFGVVTVNNSTVLSNAAGFGGGLMNTRGGSVVLNNSTVSGNSGTSPYDYDGGGAINQWFETSALTLNNSTVANNIAANPNRAESGIWLESGALTMTNSIVANNAITNNFAVESGATFASQGYNLSNHWNGLPLQGTDLTGNPRLGPVTDNGGPTWTHALQDDSLAIDAGNNAACPPTDQRGVARPQGSRCDIGAFEVNQSTLTINAAGNGHGVVTPTVGSHSYISGTDVFLTATADTGSTFTGWSGAADCDDGSVTMNADKSCTASFTLDTFVITPTAGAHGHIAPAMPQTVNYGSSLTFTLTPDAGYHIVNVGVDGVAQGAIGSYTFANVAADHTLTATFALNPPTGLNAGNDSPTVFGQATTLTATITAGLEVTYTWNFGDDSFGAGTTVTHTYPATGAYTAVVTATNNAGELAAFTTVYVIEPYRCLLPIILK